MLKSTKSQSHITPMRVRSTSRDFGSNSINKSQREIQDQIDLNYIGLRQNKAHILCCNHQQSQGLPPKAAPTSALDKVNFQLMINNLNAEVQRLIDTELKGALQTMKQDMQAQQFAFERQMCSVIGKMQNDLTKVVQPQASQDMQDYALHKDLKDLETFVIKIAEQMEDNLSSQQLKYSQILNEQNTTISQISDSFNSQQQIINQQMENAQTQINQIQKLIEGCENRQQQMDKRHEQQQVIIDRNYDELESQIRQLRDSMRTEVLKLENNQHDYEEKNQNEHEHMRSQMNRIEGRMESEGMTDKLKELEELISNQDNLSVIENMIHKIQQLEDQIKQQEQVVKEINSKTDTNTQSLDQHSNLIRELQKHLNEQGQNNNEQLKELQEQLNEVVNALESIESLKQQCTDNGDLIGQVNNKVKSIEQWRQQLQDGDIKEIQEQMERHEIEIEQLKEMQSQFKSINSDDVDQKKIEVIINQFKINIHAEIDELKELIEQLRKHLDDNVTRIDQKDKEQDDRLDLLETSRDSHDLHSHDLQQSVTQLNNKMASNNKLHQQLKQQLQDLESNMMNEFEQLENTCLNSLSSEILKQVQDNIQQYTFSPLHERLEHLEQQLETKQRVATPKKPQQTLQAQHEIMHQKLLSEMKRKRLWYLRKTPQDHIIEEIMLQRKCTQEEAERYYLEQLEKNNKLKASTENSPHRKHYTNEGALLKSRNENIIHASSPHPEAAKGSNQRSISKQQLDLSQNRSLNLSSLSARSKSAREGEVMRRPVSPHPHQEVEAAYEEASQLLTPYKTTPNRAPYIVIHSPLHESATKVVIERPIHSQQHQTQQPAHHTKLDQRQAQYNTQHEDSDIDESNIDVLDLDDDNSQMRDNFSRMDNFRESMFDRPISQAFHQTFDQHSRLSEVSQQLHPERKALLKSNPFSLVQSAQKDNNTMRETSHRDIEYKVQEVEEDWDNDEDFEQEEHKEAIDEIESIEEIEEQQPMDDTYEGSMNYDYRESIKPPEKSRQSTVQTSNKEAQDRQMFQMHEEDNQSFGDVNDLL